jgi:outer membrane protein OmpA-like peptidoglycan-associated protein
MKYIQYFIAVIFTVILVSCSASMPPPELVNARLAYQKASTGQAAQLVPADLHKAQTALELAEKAFLEDPDSYQTRDLAYIADRKSKMAEALAQTSADNAATVKAKEVFDKTQTEIVQDKTDQLAKETQARIDAEKVAAQAKDDLAKLAAVKEEARGLVITLSGGVLFETNASTLFPAAKERLNKVAEALLVNKSKKLTIEGYTDSQGSNEHNQVLSQKRAETVRQYLISRGYPENLIQASGLGEDSPVASNDNAEGRANNRRVEIVVDNGADATARNPF